jgi:hypothetical protein
MDHHTLVLDMTSEPAGSQIPDDRFGTVSSVKLDLGNSLPTSELSERKATCNIYLGVM